LIRRHLPFPDWLSVPLCLAVINLLSNCAVETSNVFIALYAKDIGSSNLQVGFIAAATGITFLVSSFFFGRLSDFHGRLLYIRLGLGLSAVSYLTQIFAHAPLSLLAARAAVGFALGVNASVMMAYTYESQRQIGSFISFGALGWLLGAITAAFVKHYTALFIISAVVASLAFILSLRLEEKTSTHLKVARFPLTLVKADYKIYLGFFLRQLGGNAIWAIWPIYQASIGASKLWIAMVEVTNMVGQIVAMRIVERFNPARMFQTGLLLSAVVFAVYGLLNHYWQLIPVQIVLSVAYSCMFVGALSYLLRHHPEYGTTSGLLNSVNAFSGVFGPFFGGAISESFGFSNLMYASALVTLGAFFSTHGLKVKITNLQGEKS
jgi:MFS family permease